MKTQFKPKFTQGTWTIDKTVLSAINCGKKHIAMINCYNCGPTNPSTVDMEEHNANVYLISAAPDMYKILELIEEGVELSNSIDAETDIQDVFKIQRKVIDLQKQIVDMYPEILKQARGLGFTGDKK